MRRMQEAGGSLHWSWRCACLLWLMLAVLALAAPPALAQRKAPCGLSTDVCNLHTFQFQDLRALGMGNAYGPIARGEGALRYNPAGLVQEARDLKVEIFGAFRGADLQFFRDTREALDSTSTSELESYLSKYNGQTLAYGADLVVDAIWNRGKSSWGVGLMQLFSRRIDIEFVDTENDGFTLGQGFDDILPEISNSAATGLSDQLIIHDTDVRIPILGFGFGVANRALLLGFALKNIQYTTQLFDQRYDDVLANSDLDDLGASADKASRSGVGLDAGLLWRLNYHTVRPTLSLTAQNLNEPELSLTEGDDGDGRYNVISAYNMGLSFSPTVGIFQLLLAAEMHDVTGEVRYPRNERGDPLVERNFSQRMHYGAELGFLELATGDFLLAVRAGINQGKLTNGAELNLFHFLRIIYAKWGEDVGHAERSTTQDNQAIAASVGFGF